LRGDATVQCNIPPDRPVTTLMVLAMILWLPLQQVFYDSPEGVFADGVFADGVFAAVVPRRSDTHHVGSLFASAVQIKADYSEDSNTTTT
jgi:hypothetical protein